MSRPESKDTDKKNKSGIAYAEIIRERRKAKGLNQEELGAMVSVRKNAVGAWESGRSRPDLSSVPVICEALGVSLEEFFGVRKEKKNGKEETGEFLARFKALTDYHQEIVLREMDILLEAQKASQIPKRKMIRIYRNDLSACAGPSYSIGETQGEQVWIEENPLTVQADEVIRVSGDSMEPRFHDGDQVLVKHHVSLHPGEIGIFTNGDSGYIKEYQRDGLHSLNPAYSTMVFSEEDEVRCIGKVIGIADEKMFARRDEYGLLQMD